MVMKNDFSSSKTLHKPRIQHYAGNITRMLASRLTHAQHLLHLFRVEFRNHSFLLASFLVQTSEDCIGNIEHHNVNVRTLSAMNSWNNNNERDSTNQRTTICVQDT